MAEEDISSREVTKQERFQAEKYFSASERYSVGAGVGAKRTSAHGRLLCGGLRKQAAKRSCCSALSLSQCQKIESEGISYGMMVGLFEGFGLRSGEGSFWFDHRSGMLAGVLSGAVSGAGADFGWVGGRGKPFDRSKYSLYLCEMVGNFISSSLTVPSYSTSGPRSSSGS